MTEPRRRDAMAGDTRALSTTELAAPVAVSRKASRRFERWMDKQLSRLEARWIHRAAPNTRWVGRESQSHK